MKHNREAWLQRATDLLRPSFKQYGSPLPAIIHISVGFPSTRGLSIRKRTIGECWSHDASTDGHAHVLVSPLLDDAVTALATLLHELIHVVLPGQAHNATFATMARDFGLEGKPTATVAGPELTRELRRILRKLGKYPHGAIKVSFLLARKQTTRMLKVSCKDCGYIARVSSFWIENVGAPKCPSGHGSMTVATKRVHWRGHKGKRRAA